MREPVRIDQLQISESSVDRDGNVFVYLWDGRLNEDKEHLFVAFGCIRRRLDGTTTVETEVYRPVSSLADARIVVNRLLDELEKAGAQ